MRYHLTDPFDLLRFLFHPPQNTWGCATPLKTLEIRAVAWPIRAGWEQSILWQNVRDAISWPPHCTNLHYVAGSSPSFHSFQYFGLISDIVLSSSLRRSPVLTVLHTWDTTFSQDRLMLSSNSISPVQSPLSPVALGRVTHMESQVGRPCSPGHIPDSSLPGADSFSWELKLKFGFTAHACFLLSKEVYFNLLKNRISFG